MREHRRESFRKLSTCENFQKFSITTCSGCRVTDELLLAPNECSTYAAAGVCDMLSQLLFKSCDRKMQI
jgi:hypothetical protein